MNRRSFLHTTLGGVALAMISERVGAGSSWKPFDFKPFRSGRYPVPVWKVTPDDGFYVHTFFDVCPWSPSGNYLLVTRFDFQGRKPSWGDQAAVCVIDLKNQRIREIYRTRAWSFQLGTNCQWDAVSDRYIYTNDIIEDEVVCVRIDWEAGTFKAFTGPLYSVSPDGRKVVSPNLLNMNIHQYGYAVPDGPSGKPIPFTPGDMEREGLWCTDLTNDRKSLLMPLSRFFEAAADEKLYEGMVGYLFHSKFNRQNTRILQVFRAQRNNEGRNASLFTLNTDGTGLKQCLSAEKWNQKARSGGSGNHPNWHPDGEHIIMNCIPTWLGFDEMKFCRFRYDGADFTVLSEKIAGSGHPSVDQSGRYLVTDAYPKQTYVKGPEGEVAIRLIDLNEDRETRLCDIPNDVGGGTAQASAETRKTGGSHFKLDPHPAWSRDYRQLCFNGAPDGIRQVFLADLQGIIS